MFVIIILFLEIKMNKRDRVFAALDHQESDQVPIHYLGFEKTASAYEDFLQSSYYTECFTELEHAHDITIQRFLNVDTFVWDPFYDQLNYWYPTPAEFPEYKLNVAGRLYKVGKNPKTGQDYSWYEKGYYTSEDLIHATWDQNGKPSEYMLKDTQYDSQTWKNFVEELEPYFYPMARLPIPMHEALFEGMTLGKLAYYMRKKPSYIHEVISEYLKTNLQAVENLIDSGVEIIFYFDDLGQKERSILSLENFREFILPYYQQLYQACRKRGVYIVQHSCGFVDGFLPDMVDAGLSCIQALEPAAGVNLANLKETLGDRVAFMGGMDSSRTLSFGTFSDIEADVKKCISAAGHGGGYFAGLSHEILNVPFDNVLALRDYIEKHRQYPLSI
jgi:uroporphyrinogen-III decarboxylase